MLLLVGTGSSSLCQLPFYNDIRRVTDSDGWILFGQDIPSTSLKKLYIRESYRTIASSIMTKEVNKAIITGTPGIGKSLFLIYLLWKLVKDKKRVLFIYHPYNIYYDGNGGVSQFAGGELPADKDYSFWNDTLWCLFDAKDKKDADLGHLPYALCTFVVSTSPRRDLVNDFKKPPVPQVFYMPLWTKDELAKIAPLFPMASGWSDRFVILGGIPRHVLEVTTQPPTQIIEAACRVCTLDECITATGIQSTVTEKSQIVHSLVHITSTHPFNDSSVCFASQTALDIIVRNKGLQARRRMYDLLASCQGNPLTAAFCGYIFEQYATELLEKGGKFICRLLEHGNKRSRAVESELIIPQSTKEVADQVLVGQALYQLYVPKTKNYASIDAWIPGIGAFQMTVAMTHDIKSSATADLAKLGKGNKLYWLLPPSRYTDFSKKKPHEIEQHAVLIPYPCDKATP
jgi:hypothetical protein